MSARKNSGGAGAYFPGPASFASGTISGAGVWCGHGGRIAKASPPSPSGEEGTICQGLPALYRGMSNANFMNIFSAMALALIWLLNTVLVWGLHRQWWRNRRICHLLWIAPLAGLLFDALWLVGNAVGSEMLQMLGRTLTTIMLTLSIAVLVALPLSGIALTIDRIIVRFREKRRVLAQRRRETGSAAMSPVGIPSAPAAAIPVPSMPAPAVAESSPSAGVVPERMRVLRPGQGPDRRRRTFLTRTAAIIPAATLGSAGFGLFRAQGPVLMPEIPLTFRGLHPDLDGLRILHLSDIHLGYYIDLGDLEEVLRAAEEKRPDMVLVSGDISDDIPVLPDALRLIAALNPRFGTYASLGNHEYFRGIGEVIRVIDAGPVPLLRDTGATVRVGAGEIYVGGADDPVRMARREQNSLFLRRTVDAAFDGAPSQAFHLLMSHRPQGFDIAADQGIQLTVAGHTHGAQMGFNGRSVLEPWMRDHYLWGHYQRGESQLYTSAGVGHWFPFRLGCPPEAPIYVLKKE